MQLFLDVRQKYKLRIQFFQPFLHEENVELNFLDVENPNDSIIDKEVEELCTQLKSVAINRAPLRTGYGEVQSYGLSQDQAMLWEEGVDVWDNGYGSAAMQGTKYYSPWDTKGCVELGGIKKKELEALEVKIEAIVDRVQETENPPTAFALWNDFVRKTNKQLKTCNLKFKEIKTSEELDNLCYYYAPQDYLENITKEVVA